MTKETKTQPASRKKKETAEQSQLKHLEKKLADMCDKMDVMNNINYSLNTINDNGKFLRIFTFLFVILALILASFSVYLATDVKNTLKFYHQEETTK